MWHEGVISDEWLTAGASIASMTGATKCARLGQAGLAPGAYLNYGQARGRRLYDLELKRARTITDLEGFPRDCPDWLHLLSSVRDRSGRPISADSGFVGSGQVPRRDLGEFGINSQQRKRKGARPRHVGQRRGDVLAPSSVDLAMFDGTGPTATCSYSPSKASDSSVAATAPTGRAIDERSLYSCAQAQTQRPLLATSRW